MPRVRARSHDIRLTRTNPVLQTIYFAPLSSQLKELNAMPLETYEAEARGSTHLDDIGTAASQFASFRALSVHDREAIGAIIEGKYRMKLAQDQMREDVKAVAEKLGMKSSELNRIVRLAMRERERGNVLLHEKALIEVAEQIFV